MKIIKTLTVLTALLFATCRQPPQSDKPDIIIMSIDTLRADHLGCYGYTRPTSPEIDLFAREAVLFRNTISPAHLTAPSHMSLFTGLNPFAHQVDNYNPETETVSPLSGKIHTLIEDLKTGGYLTVGIHGGGNIGGSNGFDRGFNYYAKDFYSWEKEENASTDKIGAILKKTRTFIRESRREGRPIFLFLHHYLCHDPYLEGPPEFNLRFLKDPVERIPDRLDLVGDQKEPWPNSNRFWENVDMTNQREREHVLALYDGGVCYSDFLFRKFADLFREEGIYDRSIIVILSDHGEEFYEHGGIRHQTLFIENIHVPLLIRFPGGRWGGTEVDERVRLVDVLPSVMKYTGVPITHPIQGISFLPLLDKQGEYHPLVSSSSFGRRSHDNAVAIFQDRYYYTNFHLGESPECLFDQENDPRQQHNLSEEMPERMGTMRIASAQAVTEDTAFNEKLDAGEKTAEIAPSDNLLEQLKALGYVQ